MPGGEAMSFEAPYDEVFVKNLQKMGLSFFAFRPSQSPAAPFWAKTTFWQTRNSNSFNFKC